MGLAKLTRKLFSPLYYAHYEHSPQVFGLFKKYCKYEQLSRSQLDRLSLRLLKRLLVHAGKHTPYYRRVFYDCGFNPKKFENLEQLQVLPVLTKKVIRKNQDDLLAENIDRSELHASSTGGTSGIKLKFYRNNLLRSHRLALQWRSDVWAGWNLHQNVGYIWPTIQDFDQDSGVKEKIFSKYFAGVQAHYAGKMNDDRKEEIAQELAHFKPKIIRCFPTPAAAVAEYIVENDIWITGIEGVVSTGEPLYPDQRGLIEKAFNAPVFNLYASREVGTTAAECERHEHLHLATDSVAVEVTDNGRQLPPGQYGEILLTDLLNYGMPMIRYQIGDYGQLVDGDCPCGRPFP
jgi:phenylacetate-CoA ligase